MNTLSWLIYLADVAGDIDSLLAFISLAATFFLILWVCAAFVMFDEGSPEDWKVWRRLGGFALLPIFFGSVILGALVPAKTTVYAIAASEMGEKALSTETGNKAFKALNAWLDRQIEGEEVSDD